MANTFDLNSKWARALSSEIFHGIFKEIPLNNCALIVVDILHHVVDFRCRKPPRHLSQLITWALCLPHFEFVLSVRQFVTQFVSATPLKLQNRMSWNLVGSKDIIFSCAYYQEILFAWIVWELCPFKLRNFPKYTSEAACQHNCSETTEQNFMKLGR